MIMPILKYPNLKLTQPSSVITEFTDDVLDMLQNLMDTFLNTPCLGLAAPQIGYHIRAIVISTSQLGIGSMPLLMINPVILKQSDELFEYKEGCLSLPGGTEKVKRPKTVTVQYHTKFNELMEIEVSDLASSCIQHEIDHLDGKLLIDHLHTIKRNRLLDKVRKSK